MNLFKSMDLPNLLVENLSTIGIHEPTPIQKRAIPYALSGNDVLGLAQTGTGKTAAFAIPIAAHLLNKYEKTEAKCARGLILAPTRELAKQISENIRSFVQSSRLKIGIVVGGVSIKTQIKRLSKGTDILVATPGRLIDLLDRDAISLNRTSFLVLDEADQMLDLGFVHSLRKIATFLPEKRQTMLFSATMPKQIHELAKSFLSQPKHVEVAPSGKVADKILQCVNFVVKAEKNRLLINLLSKHNDELALVFSRTKYGAERLSKTLLQAGFSVSSIHGNKSQGQRERALKAFRKGDIKILVATDVAARGLDIPTVKHVYNFDLPNVPENYVHRIGRTARAGSDGCAIAFCTLDEMNELKSIEKIIGSKIPVSSGEPWDASINHANKARKAKKHRHKQFNRGKKSLQNSKKTSSV